MSFREVARQWFIYARAASDLSLDYENCPRTCGNDEAEKAGATCDSCPVKEAEDNFRDYSTAALDNNPNTKAGWKKYGFDALRQSVEEIAELEDLPRGERTVKTHRLIQAFQSARNRQDRINRENDREQKPE